MDISVDDRHSGWDLTAFEFDETVDLGAYDAWLLDGIHSVPPLTPMSAALWVQFCRSGMQYGAEKLYVPTIRGWDWRLHDYCLYFAQIPVQSPDEIRRRERLFRGSVRDYV